MFRVKKQTNTKIVLSAIVVLGTLIFTSGIVMAHGDTEVGDYELTIGFLNEPAYQGELNGLDLRVVNHVEEEPVEGLEDSLQVEIIFGASTQELPLRARIGQPGAYTADVIPTEAGDYTWHIWGDIEGTPVDVELTSSPDTFSSVIARSQYEFPTSGTVSSALAEDVARTRFMSNIALLLGGLGFLMGLVSLITSLRRGGRVQAAMRDALE